MIRGSAAPPDGQAAAQRAADQRCLVQAEVIEHGADRAMPLRGEDHPAVLEGGALAGTVEGDHLVTGMRDGQHHRETVLEVPVESAGDQDAAPVGPAQPQGREHTTGVGDGVVLAGADAVDLPHQFQEPGLGRCLALVADGQEEVRGSQAERRVAAAALREQLVGEGEELADELVVVADPDGDLGDVGQRLRRHRGQPPVELVVDRAVRVQVHEPGRAVQRVDRSDRRCGAWRDAHGSSSKASVSALRTRLMQVEL